MLKKFTALILIRLTNRLLTSIICSANDFLQNVDRHLIMMVRNEITSISLDCEESLFLINNRVPLRK
uniref:Secreted protein n=1 Tax=Schistosoma mansoni TaxID=6183 RepID=A0A5K4FC84_SCHMA